MAQESNYEQFDDGGYAVTSASGKVFYNVYAVLCMTQCTAMIITGALYFGDCPGSNILNIYLIVQGALLTIIPVLLCSVFRYGCPMKKLHYYTACVTAGILCTGCLIAGSHWHDVAECKSSTLYRIALGFILCTWLFNGVYLAMSLIYRCVCVRRTNDREENYVSRF
ncbi:uncharacterized protein [Haliotis asinina]|uniref:uncharacterized protein n=1 Tax=Haliotis asinina TaxID=109174 RepID=UPI003531FBCA